MNRALLIPALLMTMLAACGGHDTSDPYGTWEFTYPAAPCGDGDRVDTIRITSAGDVFWPAPDGEAEISTPPDLDGPTVKVFAGSISDPGGMLFVQWDLDDSGAGFAEWATSEDGGCMIDSVEASVVKLEDE